MKANRKQLKAFLMLEVRKFGPYSLVLNLGEFLLFDGFLDLNNFWLIDLPVFGFIYFDLSPSLTLSTLLMASTLVLSTLLVTSTYNDIVVFNINVSDAAILLNF